jgi:hypothetical protein
MDGGDSKVFRISYAYDDQGRQIEMNYLDVEGKPVKHSDGNERILSRYDSLGRLSDSLFADEIGKPVMIKPAKPMDGAPVSFARVHYNYGDSPRTESENFLDESGKVIVHRKLP